MIIPAAHYNEVNVAWGKAMAAKGIGDHQPPEDKEGALDVPDTTIDESTPEIDNSDTPKDESAPETDDPETSDNESTPGPAPQNDGSNPATGQTAAAAAMVLITALAAIALRRKQ